jgi:hypothetical protein
MYVIIFSIYRIPLYLESLKKFLTVDYPDILIQETYP